jgi:hypothetical protein
MSDHYGAKRIYLVALVLFTAAGARLAPSAGALRPSGTFRTSAAAC